MTTALWWIRRDLRLTDNQALAAALAHADRVIPVFVLDPTLLDSPYVGPKRVAFLLGGLRRLDEDLGARGSRLIVRRGDPQDQLTALLKQCGAEAIFTEEDFTPYARQRDSGVAKRLPLHLIGGRIVHPPGAVLKADGTPYTVFTPFRRRWKTLPPPQASVISPAPERLSTPPEVGSLPIPLEPMLPSTVPFPPGEAEAQRRLSAFVGGEYPPIYRYAEARNRLDMDGTSRLSPYLHLGMVSSRQAVVAALDAIATAPDAKARVGAETWLHELIWREFFVHILYHFPHVLQQS
ncbi:MAG: deoxyribodipyrimidine photo-lyase, partial [Anaerolineae bacterium]